MRALVLPPLSTEFALALAACRASFTGTPDRHAAALADKVDWDRFLILLRRHRVVALAWLGLKQSVAAIPASVADSLRSAAEGIAADNLRAAAETKQLHERFAAAGIDHLFVKGLTLGALAYPRPFAKMSWDIDLLVPTARLADAPEVLATMDYALVDPRPPRSPAQLLRWHRHHKDSAWRRGNGGMAVELHSRLADNARLVPAIGCGSPRQSVTVAPGIVLETLADDALFAYLCVHGASSMWFRLKWITDLAALLHELDAGAIDALYRKSQEHGAGRAAGQALLLGHLLYELPLAPALVAQLELDRATRRLVRAAIGQLTAVREPSELPLGTTAIHTAQWRLLPGPRFAAGELARQIRATLVR